MCYLCFWCWEDVSEFSNIFEILEFISQQEGIDVNKEIYMLSGEKNDEES